MYSSTKKIKELIETDPRMKLMFRFADKDLKTDIINMIKNLKKRNMAENLKKIWELWKRILTNSEKFKYKIADMKELQEKQNDQQIWIQINRNYLNWVNGKKAGKKTTETHSVTWGINMQLDSPKERRERRKKLKQYWPPSFLNLVKNENSQIQEAQ